MVASKFAYFGRTGYKLKITHLVDEKKGSQCPQNGLKNVLLINNFLK